MISGIGDDRLALVIETQARLDGIKSARSEVVGLGADTRNLEISSVAATRNLSAWNALQAEAAGHVGEHSLAIGRLERNLAGVTERFLGLNPTIGLVSSSLLKFGLGTVETVGILGGIAAISAAWEYFEGAANRAEKANDKLRESLRQSNITAALGPEPELATTTQTERDENMRMRERRRILLRFGVSAEDERILDLNRRIAESDAELEKGEKRLFDARMKGAAVLKTVTVEAENFAAEAERAATRELARLNQLGNYLSSQVMAAINAQERALANREDAEKRGIALHADMQAKALELTLQSVGKETEAKIAANEAEYMRRVQDIANLADTEAQKTTLYLDAEQLRQAGLAEIRKQAADAEDRERQRAEEKVKSAEKRKAAIMLNSIDQFVHASASLQKILIQAALSPLIKELEGTAVRQFVRAAASWAAGDFVGAARHAAAGALATAGAREVAQLGEMAGGGGSAGGSAGGGGNSTTFEPRNAAEGGGMMNLTIITQNALGPDHIQNIAFQLNRSGILKQPLIEIPATTGITVKAA